MPAADDRFRAAIDKFDQANAADPHAKELLYAQQMTRCLEKLSPDAAEPLRLAARCQHIMRWTIPRSNYPTGRAGYHRWRTALQKFHAARAAEILRGVGYDDATIARVQSLVRKEGLKTDAEAQLLEDVACLVFLENYLGPFARQHDEQKVIGILRKTWAKMSQAGRKAALGLNLSPNEKQLIEKALGQTGEPREREES